MIDELEKIKRLKSLKDDNNFSYVINVDGGINDLTINEVKEMNPDMISVGSYIRLSDNYHEKIDLLR